MRKDFEREAFNAYEKEIIELNGGFFKSEAMLLSEYTAILEWLRDTVKSDAGGQLPLGVCHVDSANIAANFSDGDLVGVALSIPIKRKESLAAGAREFIDSNGTTVSTYP